MLQHRALLGDRTDPLLQLPRLLSRAVLRGCRGAFHFSELCGLGPLRGTRCLELARCVVQPCRARGAGPELRQPRACGEKSARGFRGLIRIGLDLGDPLPEVSAARVESRSGIGPRPEQTLFPIYAGPGDVAPDDDAAEQPPGDELEAGAEGHVVVERIFGRLRCGDRVQRGQLSVACRHGFRRRGFVGRGDGIDQRSKHCGQRRLITGLRA